MTAIWPVFRTVLLPFGVFPRLIATGVMLTLGIMIVPGTSWAGLIFSTNPGALQPDENILFNAAGLADNATTRVLYQTFPSLLTSILGISLRRGVG